MSSSNCNNIAHEFEELAHAHYHSERYVYNTRTHIRHYFTLCLICSKVN